MNIFKYLDTDTHKETIQKKMKKYKRTKQNLQNGINKYLKFKNKHWI